MAMTFNTWIGRIFGRAIGCPCHEDLFDFALDGLERPQQEQVRKHLADCPHCRDQVKDYAWVSEGIALLAPQVEPPAGLCDKVKLRIHAEEAQVEVPAFVSDSLGPWPRFWMRLGPVFLVLSLGMSCLALVAALHNSSAASSGPDLGNLLGCKVWQTLELKGASGSFGTLYLPSDGRNVLLSLDGLASNAPGQAYALWAGIPGQGRHYLGEFILEGAAPHCVLLALASPLAPAQELDFDLSLEEAHPSKVPATRGALKLQGTLKL